MPSHVAGIIRQPKSKLTPQVGCSSWESLATSVADYPQDRMKVNSPTTTHYVSADIERLLSDLELEFAVVTAHIAAAR